MSITKRQFLSVHTVKVREKWHNDYLRFNEGSFGEENETMFDLIAMFLETLQGTPFVNEDENTVIEVSRLEAAPRLKKITGFLSSGSYGVKGKLRHVETGDHQSIDREHAPLFNYYFCFYLPDNSNRGVLVLHSRGIHGCKTVLQHALRNFLNVEDIDLAVEIKPVTLDFRTNATLFHDVVTVKKLKITEYKPKRNEDALTDGNINDEYVQVVRVISHGKNVESLFPIAEFGEGDDPMQVIRRNFRRYTELGELAQRAEVSVTLMMDGQEKTVTLGNEMAFHLSFNITEDFEGYNRRDPSYAKLHEVSEPYINHVIDNII